MPSHFFYSLCCIATLRNSHDCLFLLIQYGGLDPSMQINSHGSTPAHLAAWKDHVDCLRVLKSGCYNCGFSSSDDDDSLVSDYWREQSIDSGASEQEEDGDISHRGAFTSILAVPRGDVKTWAADWNRPNALGETPLHVAAREGSCNAMQFFLDLAISFAEAEAMCDSSFEDNEDVSIRGRATSEDGANIKNKHMNQDEFNQGSCPSVDFSLRNNEGMDCAALAAKHDQDCIIKILASAIQQIRELEEGNSPDIKQSASDDFWHNPLSLLTTIPQERSVTKPVPQSHLSSLRRRANTDPVSFHVEHKALTKLSHSDHGTNQQHPLPRHYPSLNLNNPLERNNHETPIHVAAREGHLSVIKALFDGGCCDTAARDSLGQTALHIAVISHHLDICQFFAELNFEQFRVRRNNCSGIPFFSTSFSMLNRYDFLL
jgi:ankyrin repeat protein